MLAALKEIVTEDYKNAESAKVLDFVASDVFENLVSSVKAVPFSSFKEPEYNVLNWNSSN